MNYLFAGSYLQASNYARKHSEDRFVILNNVKNFSIVEPGSNITLVGSFDSNRSFVEVLRLIAGKALRIR